MIRSYANELEDNGMPLNMICDHVTKALKGHVSWQYVQKCLEEKYKDPDHVKSAKGRSTSRAESNSLEHHLDVVKKDVDKVFDVGQKQGLITIMRWRVLSTYSEIFKLRF